MKLFASVFAGTVMAAGVAAVPARAQVIQVVQARIVQVADVLRSDEGGYDRGAYVGPPEPVPMVDDTVMLAPDEIPSILRQQGFSQLGPIFRRGWVYTVAVLNQDGDDGRLIVDARNGEPIRFIPAMRMDSRLRDELDRMYGPQAPPPARFAREPYDRGLSPRTASRDPAASSPRHAPPALKRAAKAIAKSNSATNSTVSPKTKPKANPVTVAVAPAKPPAPANAQTVQLSGTSGTATAANEPAKTQTNPETKAEAKPATNPSTVEMKPTEPMPPVQTME